MDAIGQGFDEHGAYDKVEKKHGKVLADAVWAEAQAEMKAMKKNPRWDGDTGSGSEYSDLRGRWGLSHVDAVAVIEGTKSFKQVKEEWAKKGNKLEPFYDLRGNPREYLEISKTDPRHVIKVTPIQLKILIKAHKQKHREFHPQSETQARNIARLKEKGLFDFIVDKELQLSVYKLSAKGHKLISEYLSHRGAK